MKHFAVLLFVFFPAFAIAEHSLREIERNCEIYRYSNEYGELECSHRVSDRRKLERKCEAYIYDFPYGEIECSGSHFRNIEKRCEVYMYSAEYGQIDC